MNIGTVNRTPGQPPDAPAAGSSRAPASTPQPTTGAPAPDKARGGASQSPEVSGESLKRLVEQVSKEVPIERRSLAFSVNDELGKTIVQVIDRDTEEVIRQIPSEEFVRFAETLRALKEQRPQDGADAAGTGLLIQAQA